MNIYYQVGEGVELDEIVGGVRGDDEVVGGLQSDGGGEVGEAEGDGAPVVDVAWVAQQSHPRIDFVLNHSRFRIHLQFSLSLRWTPGGSLVQSAVRRQSQVG